VGRSLPRIICHFVTTFSFVRPNTRNFILPFPLLTIDFKYIKCTIELFQTLNAEGVSLIWLGRSSTKTAILILSVTRPQGISRTSQTRHELPSHSNKPPKQTLLILLCNISHICKPCSLARIDGLDFGK
jgi:hypothetical protein